MEKCRPVSGLWEEKWWGTWPGITDMGCGAWQFGGEWEYISPPHAHCRRMGGTDLGSALFYIVFFLLGFNYECRCLLACCVGLLSWTFLIPSFWQVFLPYPYSKSHAVQWRLFERLFTDFRDCLSQFDYFHVLSQAKHKFELIPPAWLGYWTIIVILFILDRKKLISFCSFCCTMSCCAHFSLASSYLSCAQSHVHNNSVGDGLNVFQQFYQAEISRLMPKHRW
jgi:hypothetical protein